MDPKYYKILGVPSNATKEQIKKAYRAKAMKLHPDRDGDEDTFKKLGEAYRKVSNSNLGTHGSQSTQTYNSDWDLDINEYLKRTYPPERPFHNFWSSMCPDSKFLCGMFAITFLAATGSQLYGGIELRNELLEKVESKNKKTPEDKEKSNITTRTNDFDQ